MTLKIFNFFNVMQKELVFYLFLKIGVAFKIPAVRLRVERFLSAINTLRAHPRPRVERGTRTSVLQSLNGYVCFSRGADCRGISIVLMVALDIGNHVIFACVPY